MTYLSRQKGFAIGYLFAALALAGLVAFQLSKTSRTNAQGDVNFQNRAALLDQYHLIRSRILACGINFPYGDNGTTFRIRYPATPGSGLVRDLTCPGQDPPNNLWTGLNGLILPAEPPALNPWRYENDATSMRLSIQARSASDTHLLGVMDQVVSTIGSAASRSGDVLTVVLMN